ncbi:hypothetical protein C8J57DRAFT_1630952 [Mycena rebaudengoi]|nr:hypothetical protein C8J57DRAFT_1630952 [Mycena rebaudengoi]
MSKNDIPERNSDAETYQEDEDEVPALVKAAMHKYSVRIGMFNPFPSSDLQMAWVKKIWDEVCMEAGDSECMQLTEHMASTIKKHGSHTRGSLKDRLRPLIAPTYNVGDSDKTIATMDVEANKDHFALS